MNRLEGLATDPWWIFSADDHLFEATETFAGRVPAKYAELAPRLVEHNGGDAWLMEGVPVQISSSEGFASYPPGERPSLKARASTGAVDMPGATRQEADAQTPTSAEQRKLRGIARVAEDFGAAVYDVHARIPVMDRDGVWASVLIPSATFGFAGQRLSLFADPELGLACVHAYNDWLYEEIGSVFPERLVPSQVPWLRDPTVGAAEIRRNAQRGFRATLFPENPERFGFPSIHNNAWDPFFLACEETETVLNVHLGTGLTPTAPSSDSPLPVVKATVATNPPISAFDWVFSGIPQRFPSIKVAFTEGGIDWVPMVVGRLETYESETLDGYWEGDLSPTEILFRNFWFAALFDVGAYQFLAERCPDHVMIETDYPHPDSVWPHSREHFASRLAGLSPAIKEKYMVTNACDLYRHPLPNRPATPPLR